MCSVGGDGKPGRGSGASSGEKGTKRLAME